MQQPFTVLLAFVSLGAVLFGLFASLSAFFPRQVRLARRAAEESPGRSLLLGAVNTAFVAALSLTLLAAGEGRGPVLTTLGVLLLAAGLSALAVGLAGSASLVGNRLLRRGGGMSEILVGTVSLTLASATPLLGWFVFLPGVIFLGLGSFLLGWSRRRIWEDVL